MEFRFDDWLGCPRCDGRDTVPGLVRDVEMVIECRECGLVSKFEIGAETSLQNLDAGAISDAIGK